MTKHSIEDLKNELDNRMGRCFYRLNMIEKQTANLKEVFFDTQKIIDEYFQNPENS